jgi:hypothetical protein
MTAREAIEKIARSTVGNTMARIGSVVSVNDSERTCTVKAIDTEIELTDVRLQTDPSNGVFLKPKVGSFVVVVPFQDFEYVVVMYSAIDEIILLDGSLGGLIKISDLVSKLNVIENKVNDLIGYINSHSHASNGSPPSPPYSGGNLSNTTVGQIENPKVKHGNI